MEVHVEQINISYSKLLEWCKIHPTPMLMLCVNETHWKNGIGVFHDTYPCYSCNEEIKKYYLMLKQVENPKGLHVHISREIEKISWRQQYRAIKFGKDFLEKLGIPVKDFTPGWFSFNSDTIKICKELGLSLHIRGANVNPRKHRFLLKKPIIETVKVEEVLHDYELCGYK